MRIEPDNLMFQRTTIVERTVSH